MTHAIINEFVVHADNWIDLHGGDIPEDLVPFVICRGGTEAVDLKSREMAMAFGSPYVLTVSKPIQPAKGTSSYVAGVERGVPSILAEAGGVGQMQEEAVVLLVQGVLNVMRYLGMMARVEDVTASNVEIRIPKLDTSSKWKGAKEGGLTAHSAVATEEGSEPFERRSQTAATVLTSFEWIYAKHAGMWYPRIKAGDKLTEGQEIGTVGDLFGDTLEMITAPVNGTALFLTINPAVQEKGLLMGIGTN
jgi:predicted deacylase